MGRKKEVVIPKFSAERKEELAFLLGWDSCDSECSEALDGLWFVVEGFGSEWVSGVESREQLRDLRKELLRILKKLEAARDVLRARGPIEPNGASRKARELMHRGPTSRLNELLFVPFHHEPGPLDPERWKADVPAEEAAAASKRKAKRQSALCVAEVALDDLRDWIDLRCRLLLHRCEETSKKRRGPGSIFHLRVLLIWHFWDFHSRSGPGAHRDAFGLEVAAHVREAGVTMPRGDRLLRDYVKKEHPDAASAAQRIWSV